MKNSAPIFISREELYHRIWSTPVKQLAAELGVAESRLRKLCDRNNIPRPEGGGYWHLVKWGKAPARIPLPAGDGTEAPIRLDLPLTPIEEMARDLHDALTVPPQLTAPLDCIRKARDWCEAKDRESGAEADETVIRVRVSAALRERALCILDTLLKAIQKRGHPLLFRNHAVYVPIDNEEIKLSIRETLMYVGKQRTFTGRLRVQVQEEYRALAYSDSEGITLEGQLAKIIVAVEAESGKIKQVRKEREDRWAAWERPEQEGDEDPWP